MNRTPTKLAFTSLAVAGVALQSVTAGQAHAAYPDQEPAAVVTAVEFRSMVFQPSDSALGEPSDDPAEALESTDEWRSHFNSWIWMLGMEGDIGVGDATIDVSASFADILEASDSLVAISGRLEISNGTWGAFVDGMYSNIGVDNVGGGPLLGDTDITIEMTLIDFGLKYRIGQWEPSGEAAKNPRDIMLDLYAGGRYTRLDNEIDPSLKPNRSETKDWLDPIIGAQLQLPLSEKWQFDAIADVGGFGVESDLTWSTTAVFGRDFTLFDHPATTYFGYRILAQDYEDNSGAQDFTWDVMLHGPIFGFSVKF